MRDHLSAVFGRYGLPQTMLMGNGSPWGLSHGGHPRLARFTPLTVWLMRLGIQVTHGRPYRSQTRGKEERFHRTLKAEVLHRRSFRALADCHAAFDHWRQVYNLQRPHQALDPAVPASRYQPSRRSFPAVLPAIEYRPDDHVRKVQHGGWINFRGHELRLPRVFSRPAGRLATDHNRPPLAGVFCRPADRRARLARPADHPRTRNHVPDHL